MASFFVSQLGVSPLSSAAPQSRRPELALMLGKSLACVVNLYVTVRILLFEL